jgi:hypothetical protein
MYGLTSSVFGILASAESYEHSDEPSGSFKGMQFFDRMSEYEHMKDSGPWC